MNTSRIVCYVEKENFNIDKEHMKFNVNDNTQFNYTFWNNKRLIDFPQRISDSGLDLLYISLFVYEADRIILRNTTEDAWTRNITLYVPVLDLSKWNKNKKNLETLLNFLSGDVWTINFRKRNFTLEEREYISAMNRLIPEERMTKVNTISMFSGGLDSFIGAIDLLQNMESSKLIFVSHYGRGKGVKEYQDVLRNKIIEKYLIPDDNFFSFHSAAIKGVEDTTRTRSFMFFSHAIALGTGLGKNIDLIIPENGFISLNIPLTNSRLGSSSTRTTHPYYVLLLQKLLDNLDIKIKIRNPFQFKTKGEMIVECKNKQFLIENIDRTMSCSHPDSGRMKRERVPRHCGFCLPCVIRRAALHRAKVIDKSNYRDLDFISGETAKLNLNSYLLGIEKYSSKYAFFNIQKSGPIVENIDAYVKLYNRGMLELKKVLEPYKGKGE